MDYEIIEQFNRFWRLYKVDETLFPRRRAATLKLWIDKHPLAREAMLKEVEENGGPKGKNPYFYVQEFAEPEPQWLTGQGQEKALRDGFIVCICLDASKPSNPRMRPIELNEARHFKLPCLRFEFIDQESGRLIHRDHTALDFTHLPMMPKKGN